MSTQSNVVSLFRWLEACIKALAVCALQKPEDPRVLFLEGRLQLALLNLSDEQKAPIAKNVKLPEVNMAQAEEKLRKSIQLNPKPLASYMTLALVLLELEKPLEAHKMVDAALALERTTRADDYLAKLLEKVKAFLVEQQTRS